MFFLQEANELKKYLLSWFFSFIAIIFILFSVGLSKAFILGKEVYIPVFSQHSLTVVFFQAIKRDLVPSGVILIATSPLSVFISQVKIAIVGALIVTFPFLLYKLSCYISPALYAREKRAALMLLIPSTFLFVSGAVFAYFMLIPPTFALLYSFNTILGVTPFFAIDEFISWTLAAMFATGILFLLPVFMYLLTRFGIIPPLFWREQWRVSLVVFLIIAAIITPDPSGITMIIIALPMIFLYGIGATLSARTK